MGRTPGSPNVNEYHWKFSILNPSKPLDQDSEVLWEKKYIKIADMHDDLHHTFTLAQLRSYAGGTRNAAKNIKITRICEPANAK